MWALNRAEIWEKKRKKYFHIIKTQKSNKTKKTYSLIKSFKKSHFPKIEKFLKKTKNEKIYILHTKYFKILLTYLLYLQLMEIQRKCKIYPPFNRKTCWKFRIHVPHHLSPSSNSPWMITHPPGEIHCSLYRGHDRQSGSI